MRFGQKTTLPDGEQRRRYTRLRGGVNNRCRFCGADLRNSRAMVVETVESFYLDNSRVGIWSLPIFYCPDHCDCQSPYTNPAGVSELCPIHNLYPVSNA